MSRLSFFRRGLAWALRAVHARLQPADVVSTQPTLDPQTLKETAAVLEEMLAEVDDLSRALPSDAQPIGLAARELLERSLAECSKPVADAQRVVKDMEQVQHLALAMRERLLLNPRGRTGGRPS